MDQYKRILLEAAQEHIINNGWTMDALEEGAVSIGRERLYARTLFFDIGEAVSYFEEQENIKMLDFLATQDFQGKIRATIAAAISYRLKNIPGSEKMLKRLREFYLRPSHMAYATKNLWQTCDVIWRYAGDKSTDYNYYTKRSLLAGVYAAAVEYFLRDQSLGSTDSDIFIARSLDRIVKVSRLPKIALPKLTDLPVLRMFL